MTDFEKILEMLVRNGIARFTVDLEENPCIEIPSFYPENYTTGVTISFDENENLCSIHSYKED